MKFWILKTEPNTYSFDDLVRDKKTSWDGVRNYQARNNLRLMKKGDQCFIYHSVGPKNIAGLAKVIKPAYQDPTIDDDRWVAVDIAPQKCATKKLTLENMKSHPLLSQLQLIKQSRLSVCPISADDFEVIRDLGGF